MYNVSKIHDCEKRMQTSNYQIMVIGCLDVQHSDQNNMILNCILRSTSVLSIPGQNEIRGPAALPFCKKEKSIFSLAAKQIELLRFHYSTWLTIAKPCESELSH